ncbi:MAG: hypothetical protein LH477_12635 [Nocardioides sp.]|nr:hypothetical protein [Nocardioides sp.]
MAQETASTPRVTPPWLRLLVALWPLLLACLLVMPLLTGGGYPLARDLVFVPHQPFTDSAWGLGDGPPRAVPLDAVVSALSWLVDGAVVVRVVLPLTLALAGWGVARLVTSLGPVAQLAAATFAIWNAYVVERLALGQWALLVAYAALPWLVAAAGRFRRGGRPADAGAALAWAALASLTPTGGLLAVAGLAAAGLARTRRSVVLLLGGLLLQAPWLASALTTTAGRLSDPAGIAAFAPDTDARWGIALALLGLGGIWDSGAEPASRTTWLALVAAAAVVVVLVAGWSGLRRTWGTNELTRWAVLAGASALVALASTTGTGREALEWAVESVPGAGLLRDAQKLLAPVAMLVAAAFGVASARLVERMRLPEVEVRLAALAPLAVSPFLLLPDAMAVTWPTVSPVHYPAGFDHAAQVLDGSSDDLLVTLPWRSYRKFDWAPHDLTSSDPAVRWWDVDVVTSDDLQVGTTLVAGESELAAKIGEALDMGPPSRTLGTLGVSWVLVYRDDPDVDELDLTGLVVAYEDDDLSLLAVPDPAPVAPVDTGRRALVMGAHLGWLAILLTASAAALSGPARRLVSQASKFRRTCC